MLIRSEKGQGLAEYALILALIAIVCIVVLHVPGHPDPVDPQHRSAFRDLATPLRQETGPRLVRGPVSICPTRVAGDRREPERPSTPATPCGPSLADCENPS